MTRTLHLTGRFIGNAVDLDEPQLDGEPISLGDFLVGMSSVDGLVRWAIGFPDADRIPEPVVLKMGGCTLASPDVEDIAYDNPHSLWNVLHLSEETERFEQACMMLDDNEKKWAERGRKWIVEDVEDAEEANDARFILLDTDALMAVRTSLTLCRDGSFDPELPALVRRLLFDEAENDFQPIPPPILVRMLVSHLRDCGDGIEH